MVHAWIWSDNPGTVFSDEHRGLPYLRVGLPSAYAEGADRAAAMGVSLIAPGACDDRGRLHRLLRLERAQRAALGSACRRAAAQVRSAMDASPEALNQAAAAAWRVYQAEQSRVLTAEQTRRLLALQSATVHAGHP